MWSTHSWAGGQRAEQKARLRSIRGAGRGQATESFHFNLMSSQKPLKHFKSKKGHRSRKILTKFELLRRQKEQRTIWRKTKVNADRSVRRQVQQDVRVNTGASARGSPRSPSRESRNHTDTGANSQGQRDRIHQRQTIPQTQNARSSPQQETYWRYLAIINTDKHSKRNLLKNS